MNPLSGVLGETWKLYKAHAAHLLVIAFVIYLVAAVLAGLLSLAGGIIGALLGSIIEFFAAFLLQAALVKAVQDVRAAALTCLSVRPSPRPLPIFGPSPGRRSWPASRSPSGSSCS